MTHYTNITTLSSDKDIIRPCSFWEPWSTGLNEWLSNDVSGSISGFVTLKGLAMSGERVSLYCRATGTKIATVLTGADGSFTFNNLDKSKNTYYAVSFLKGPYTEPEKYNALIYDLLQPQ